MTIRQWLWDWTVERLVERARRTPYFHLHHGDGTLYMERYWLVPTPDVLDERDVNCYRAVWWREPFIWLCQHFGIAMRIHMIHTPDLDRALHDHPWNFTSVILRGWYTELLPYTNGYPCFSFHYEDGVVEATIMKTYHEGNVVRHHAADRHRIINLSGECWTLFITGPKRQWWGFYTSHGKVYYKDYQSVHNKVPVGKVELQGQLFQGRDETCDRT